MPRPKVKSTERADNDDDDDDDDDIYIKYERVRTKQLQVSL